MMTMNSTEAFNLRERTVFDAYCHVCDDRVTEHSVSTPETASREFMDHWRFEHNPDGSYRDPCPKCGGRMKIQWSVSECVDCPYTFCY